MMRWSTACSNAPDETPRMRAMQLAADPDRSVLEQTGRNRHSFFRRFLGGPVRSPVACSHWVDGVSRLRLPEKDRPGSGPRVAHWVENDAFPYLERSQSETLRDHIWCKIHTAWGMELCTHPHASERTKSADNAASSVVVVVVVDDVKILTIKYFTAHVQLITH